MFDTICLIICIVSIDFVVEDVGSFGNNWNLMVSNGALREDFGFEIIDPADVGAC